MAAFFTLGLQSQTTLETFFCLGAEGALVPSAPTKRCTNQAISGIYRSFVGAAGTAAPPDPGR